MTWLPQWPWRWAARWRRTGSDERRLLREARAAVGAAQTRSDEIHHELNVFAAEVAAALAGRRPP